MVSIHAPARGATEVNRLYHCRTDSFNPRAREGRDNPRRRGLMSRNRFNPRAREGRDVSLMARTPS